MQKWKLWIPAIVIMTGIFWFSNIPHLSFFDAQSLSPEILQFIQKYSFSTGDKGFFSYAIRPHPDYIIHKIGHILAYGLLGIALYYAVGRRRKLAVLLTAMFAASDELHQSFVAGRSSLFGDVILDTLSAILFIYALRHIRERNSSRMDG